MSEILTMDMINSARENLRGVSRVTPVIGCDRLSEDTGCDARLKLECLQHTGAFKVRGAYNKVANLTDEERSRGLIAASTGNHAQGVAYAARACGARCVICMPESSPAMKVKRTRELGAEIVMKGETFNDAADEAVRLQKEKGYTFVHPYGDPYVMAGQGTIGCEMLEQIPDADVLVVAIGGGGLISGISYAAKHIRPGIRIVGVQTANLPSMKVSIERGECTTVEGRLSIADGLMAKRPSESTFSVVREYVDDIVTVEESEIKRGIVYLMENAKVTPEGAGACAVAAMLSGKVKGIEGRKVGALVCGGNIDMKLLGDIIAEEC